MADHPQSSPVTTIEIPDEVLHAFANAYMFTGGSRLSGKGKLEFTIWAGRSHWATIDLFPGLKAALSALAAIPAVAAGPLDEALGIIHDLLGLELGSSERAMKFLDENSPTAEEVRGILPTPAQAPTGFALVPLIPTPAMIEAGCENNPTIWNPDTDDGFTADVANDVYVSMVRAYSLSRPERG